MMKTVVENPSWMDFFQGAEAKKFIFEDEQVGKYCNYN